MTITPQSPLPLLPLKHLRASDLRGVAQLATQATRGVTSITEGVHQSVWRTLGASGDAKTGGITGLVYKSVHGVTQLVGAGLDAALAKLQPLFDLADLAAPETYEREAVLAALNGVMGDRLVADGNPLATPMSLRYQGQALDGQALPQRFAPTGKILLLAHGLCMNDLQWATPLAASGVGDPPGVYDHGASLAAALNYTPVYLRYNTGLHTSENGRELAARLESLFSHWPVPVENMTVLAHSMGGLVTRSAVHLANQQAFKWPHHLKNIVFLGTPHHGAPLERAGNWVDVILGSTPWSRPFARLGRLRSGGITDLRYGHVLDADWQGQDRFRKKPDSRQPLPLPQGVACYTVAATVAAQRSLAADQLVGDGLVPLPSALGQHDNPVHRLKFDKKAQRVVWRTNHMQLLSSPAVTQQLVSWLSSPTS